MFSWRFVDNVHFFVFCTFENQPLLVTCLFYAGRCTTGGNIIAAAYRRLAWRVVDGYTQEKIRMKSVWKRVQKVNLRVFLECYRTVCLLGASRENPVKSDRLPPQHSFPRCTVIYCIF